MKYGFIIDNRKCIGCHACTVACKSEHDMPIGVNRTWVKYVEKGEFPDTKRVFTVMRCNHCDKAPCAQICPVGALFRRDDGIVDFNRERCVGCKSCMQACPYNALYIDPNTNTAAKCNFCAHRIDLGLNPSCVNACPEQAIIMGDLDSKTSKISKILSREKVQTRRADKGTTPKLYYIDGDSVALNPMAAPPGNHLQQMGQTRGVGHFAGKEGCEAIDAGGLSYKVLPQKARRTHDIPSKGVLWRWEIPAYLMTKGIAAGAFIIMALSYFFGPKVTPMMTWLGTGSALLLLLATVGFLIKDLDRPDRFMYMILRPQTGSWIFKGVLSMFGFGAAIVFWAGGEFFSLPWLMAPAASLGVVSGIMLALYTAFLMGQAKGRDFWQSPMLIIHMAIHSAVAGAAFWVTAPLVIDIPPQFTALATNILAGSVALGLLVLLLELVSAHPTTDAKLTVRMIVGKKFGKLFFIGGLLVGNILPLALLYLGYGPIAAAAALIGVLIIDHIWVKAPQLIPLS